MRPLWSALLVIAFLLLLSASAGAKVPTEAVILSADGANARPVTDQPSLSSLGQVFEPGDGWVLETADRGSPVPYRYVVLLTYGTGYEYTYFYMPGDGSRLGYFFQAGGERGDVAYLYHSTQIDGVILPLAPTATVDGRYIVGDQVPTVRMAPAAGAPIDPLPWAAAGFAVLIPVAWVIRRRFRNLPAKPDSRSDRSSR